MAPFQPYYPPRLDAPPSALRRLALARRNLVAMWEADAFTLEFSATHILRRSIFLCNCPEAVQFAFSLKNASFERKSAQHRNALEPLLGDGLFVSDGALWRTRRRAVAPTIHLARMPEFAPAMVEAALETRERLAAKDGETIDALEEAARLTAEIICRTLFGRKLGAAHAGAIVRGFSDYQRRIGQLDILSFLGLPQWLPRWHGIGARRAANRVRAVLDEIVAASKSDRPGSQASIVAALLAGRDEETGAALDDDAIRNETAVLFMAGHETTANTLAWALYLLSQAPEVEARFHAEIDGVLGARPPTLADLPELSYTRAILDETLRLYPPVPLLSREALADETFRGETIRKGALVLVVPWLLHRHRKYWDRPDHFMPERFLPEHAGTISKFAYIPFSIGPRICAGMSFGMTEAMLCLAALGQSLRLRLKPGHDVRPVCRLTLRPEGGLPMIVARRTPAPAHPAPLPGSGRIATGCPVNHR